MDLYSLYFYLYTQPALIKAISATKNFKQTRKKFQSISDKAEILSTQTFLQPHELYAMRILIKAISVTCNFRIELRCASWASESRCRIVAPERPYTI